MRLKVQRVGGMLPALRPSVTHDLAGLPDAQRQVLERFLAQGGRVKRAAHAEAMNYLFTLEPDDPKAAAVTVSAALAQVPEELRALLPAAASARGGKARG